MRSLYAEGKAARIGNAAAQRLQFLRIRDVAVRRLGLHGGRHLLLGTFGGIFLHEVEERGSGGSFFLRFLHNVAAIELLDERAKLQFLEESAQFGVVRLLRLQAFQREVGGHGNVSLYRHKELREAYLLLVLPDARLLSTLQFVGTLQHLLHTSKALNQGYGRLWPYAGASRHVVGGVAYERQVVYHLLGRLKAVLLGNLCGSQYLPRVRALPWALHEDARLHKLGVVFVGGNHVNLHTASGTHLRHCSNDVVGLVARHFEYGDVVGADNVLNRRDAALDVLGRSLSLRFVVGISLVAERRPCGVEGNGDVVGRLLAQKFVQSPYEAKGSRGVHAL